MSASNSSIVSHPDLQSVQEAIIPLEPEHIEQARQLSRQTTVETSQWRLYIQALAFYGFEDWLRDRLAQGVIDTQHCSLLQPEYAAVLEATCWFKVGEFSLCLMTTESVAQEIVTLPRAVLDLPEFTAHFYILLEVREELSEVILRGCLRHDQWVRYQQALNLEASLDWTYQIPLDLFDPDCNHLLVSLRFLSPESLPLPAPADSVRSRLSHVRPAVEQHLAQLQPNVSLNQQLTWEQGAALLTCPPLLTLWQRWQNTTEPTDSQEFVALLNQLVAPVINLWQWSQNRLDEWTQTLSWSVPQPLIPAAAMRQSTEKVAVAIADLVQRQAIDLPTHAHYATQLLDHPPLQIGVVTWDLPDDAWALLVILVAQPGNVLPPGIQLQVGVTTVLAQVTLEHDDLYLYIPVEAAQTEEFTVTILPPNELPVTLPVFAYHAD